MNILVLNGSPKLKSDTMRLTRSFLEALTSQTACDVTIVDVIKKKNTCWASTLQRHNRKS